MRRRLAVALSVCAFAATAEPPELDLTAHVVVKDVPAEFGGLSAVEVADGGKRAQVLSDRGQLFEVGLWRDQEGLLTKVAVLGAKYLYVYDPKFRIDSEGLALAPDGGVFVSSEKPDAVYHYPARNSWPDRTWAVPDRQTEESNRGLEALAIDAEGRLVTVPETVPDGETGFPVHRLQDDAWHRIATLEASGGFSVVGADFGPDGRLYILERSVSALGFRTRIRRLSLADEDAPVETLYRSRLGQFDNLEGISLWQDAAGSTHLTLVSDNNFLIVQRTEFVEFLLRE